MQSLLTHATLITTLSVLTASPSFASEGRKATLEAKARLSSGTFTIAETDRGGTATIQLDLPKTSVVVATQELDAPSTVMISRELRGETFAEVGLEVFLGAGSHDLEISVESPERSKVGVYAAQLQDLVAQRLVDKSGNTAGYTMAINPKLIASEAIQRSVGSEIVSATLVLTAQHAHLVVEGDEDTMVIEYSAKADAGRAALGQYGLSDLESAVIDLSSLDDDLSLGNFDPLNLPLADLKLGETITAHTDSLGTAMFIELLNIIDGIEDIAEQALESGTHSGWIGGAAGGALGGAIGTALGGPAGGFVMGTALGEIASRFEDALKASMRDDDGDGLSNGADPDMDNDGIPNHRDDDIDGDNTPNDEDDYPRDKKRSISAETEGPMVPTWLMDTPLGNTDLAFDIQVERIMDDLDQIELWGAMGGN